MVAKLRTLHRPPRRSLAAWLPPLRRLAANVRAGSALGLALALTGCAAVYQPKGAPSQKPAFTQDALIAADGARLPARQWLPPDRPPWAVLVALHGMNDYSNAFDEAAQYWAFYGVATYAYDQRGFGASARPGIWSSADTMVADLTDAVDAAASRHPGVPIYLLGESMGGAVLTTALASPGAQGVVPSRAREPVASAPPRVAAAASLPGLVPASAARRDALAGKVAGAILSAPAVWGRQSMNGLYRMTLWLGASTLPGLALEPPRGLKITASDNIDMLRALGRDPLVLKRTRLDALDGLVDLMTRAQDALPHLPRSLPLLVMYGRNEEVLPPKLVADTLARLDALRPAPHLRVAVYEHGYHMLLRDRQAETVWRDVLAWMAAPDGALPSAADQTRPRTLATGPAAGLRTASGDAAQTP